eukprot:COSAG01_NODE_96_length_26789_cov_36.697089_2_plen_43_part_00
MIEAPWVSTTSDSRWQMASTAPQYCGYTGRGGRGSTGLGNYG